jgi:ribulose-phosphate 3-epimerase
MPKIQIMPSILAADIGNLEAAVRQCEAAGADQIHLDIMDGVFVPNISMGPAVAEMANRVTSLPLNVHLMLTDPQAHIDAFVRAGADTILIHVEAHSPVEETLRRLRDLGCRSGLTINPPTPAEVLFPYLDQGLADEVLVMSVHPGFGGQKYLSATEAKVATLRLRWPELDLSIDGGIDLQTVASAAVHGANLFVAGTALFKAPEMGVAVAQMRATAEAAFCSKL